MILLSNNTVIVLKVKVGRVSFLVVFGSLFHL